MQPFLRNITRKYFSGMQPFLRNATRKYFSGMTNAFLTTVSKNRQRKQGGSTYRGNTHCFSRMGPFLRNGIANDFSTMAPFKPPAALGLPHGQTGALTQQGPGKAVEQEFRKSKTFCASK